MDVSWVNEAFLLVSRAVDCDCWNLGFCCGFPSLLERPGRRAKFRDLRQLVRWTSGFACHFVAAKKALWSGPSKFGAAPLLSRPESHFSVYKMRVTVTCGPAFSDRRRPSAVVRVSSQVSCHALPYKTLWDRFPELWSASYEVHILGFI